MDLKYYIKMLEKFGLKVNSWKPGRRRIYQVCVELPSGGIKSVSPNLYANELKAWVQGFITAKEGV